MRGARFLVFGVFAVAFALLPAAAFADVIPDPNVALTPSLSASSSPTPKPKPSPSPSPTATPTPIPTPQGSIFLNPNSAPPATRVTFSGTGLPISTQIEVLLDGSHLDNIFTDGAGAFTVQLAIPDDVSGVNHQICLHENYGNVCTGFTLEPRPTAAPTPTDTPSAAPSPSPSDSPVALAATPTPGGTTPLALLTKPPFLFLPIVAAMALLVFLGLYLWRVRPSPPIGEVTILHRAPAPRVYESQPEVPRPVAPPPPAPIVYESPTGPLPPPPAPRPTAPPSGADVPPDMPEASD